MEPQAANNRLTGWVYDANGNPVYGAGYNRYYDLENRLTIDQATNTNYWYDHEGKRYSKVAVVARSAGTAIGRRATFCPSRRSSRASESVPA